MKKYDQFVNEDLKSKIAAGMLGAATLATPSCGPDISPEHKKELETEITNLEQQKDKQSDSVDFLVKRKELIQKQVSELEQELVTLNKIKKGERPVYIIKVELSQSHFTLDIEQHMKDASNSIEFELPVDKDYYNKVEVGQNIVDEFRIGSLIFSGSFGDWEMEVKSKRIEYTKEK